jgi:flagellin
MNELAVKAANGTNSSSDRDAIQDEIDQLTTEIDRVSETTKFNETYLLMGDENGTKETNFSYKQVEVTKQDLYYVEGNEVKKVNKGTLAAGLDSDIVYFTTDAGGIAGAPFTASGDAFTSSSKVFTSVSYANVFYKDSNDNYISVAKGDAATASSYYSSTPVTSGAIDATFDSITTLAGTGTGYYFITDAFDSDGNKYASGEYAGSVSNDYKSYYSKSTNITLLADDSITLANAKTTSTVQFVDKDGNEIAANGLSKYLDSDGTLKSGAELYIKTGDGITDHKLAGTSDVSKMVDSSKKFDVGSLTLSLHVGADATKNNQISVELKSMSAETLGVKGLQVSGTDDTNALNSIETISAALDKVSEQRSALGAIQNRLEHTINNLDNVVENTTSAESQIRDTDMATEMVRYSNAQVLSQAGQAMLAQANQSNQGVLSLLG